jgi:hypothetical protein
MISLLLYTSTSTMAAWRSRTLLTFLAVLVAACGAPPEEYVPPERFFPPQSVSDFEQEWYAKHLSAMREPALVAEGKPSGYFAIRILYLPTWGPPVAIRYGGTPDNFERRAVQLTGHGGYDPGEIMSQNTDSLSADDYTKLLAQLTAYSFWSLPRAHDVRGFDGSNLIVETVKDGHHQVLLRWTPEHDSEARGLAPLVEFYNLEFSKVKLLAAGG